MTLEGGSSREIKFGIIIKKKKRDQVWDRQDGMGLIIASCMLLAQAKLIQRSNQATVSHPYLVPSLFYAPFLKMSYIYIYVYIYKYKIYFFGKIYIYIYIE